MYPKQNILIGLLILVVIMLSFVVFKQKSSDNNPVSTAGLGLLQPITPPVTSGSSGGSSDTSSSGVSGGRQICPSDSYPTGISCLCADNAKIYYPLLNSCVPKAPSKYAGLFENPPTYGDQNSQSTTTLQKALNLSGVAVPITGNFGQSTLDAVKTFKKDNKLSSTNSIDLNTNQALYNTVAMQCSQILGTSNKIVNGPSGGVPSPEDKIPSGGGGSYPCLVGVVVSSPTEGGGVLNGHVGISYCGGSVKPMTRLRDLFIKTAHASGLQVSLSSSNPSIASVPSSVTVPDGSFGADFTINTSAVSSLTNITISATYGKTETAILTLVPPKVQSLSLNPKEVGAPGVSTGTVSLSGVAPSGGTVVALSSSNPSVASVPSVVTVPVGSKTVDFTINALTVSAFTNVTITVTAGGASLGSVLKVGSLQSQTLTYKGCSYIVSTVDCARTFTIPQNLVSMKIEAWGGGGGGGGGGGTVESATQYGGPGGGGGSQGIYKYEDITNVAKSYMGQTASVIVGTGGRGGSAVNYSGNGGNGYSGLVSRVSVGATVLLSASGGIGGTGGHQSSTGGSGAPGVGGGTGGYGAQDAGGGGAGGRGWSDTHGSNGASGSGNNGGAGGTGSMNNAGWFWGPMAQTCKSVGGATGGKGGNNGADASNGLSSFSILYSYSMGCGTGAGGGGGAGSKALNQCNGGAFCGTGSGKGGDADDGSVAVYITYLK